MLEKLLLHWTESTIAHPWRWLIVYVFLLFVGLFGTSRLGLSTNLNLLLPQDTASVQTAREASERVGSTDFLVVAIEGSNPERNREIADALVFAMRRDIPELEEVVARIELDFFKQNALLYFDTEELQRLLQQLRTVLGRARFQAMGLLVLPHGEDPEAKKLEAMLQHSNARAQVPSEFQNAASSATSGGYFASPDGTIFAVIGRPRSLSVDMALARRLVRNTESVIANVLKNFPHPHPKVEVAGGYRNRVAEYDSILADVKSSFLVSFLLIAALTIVFFRSVRPIPLIFLPLIFGIVLTLGLVRAVSIEKLNVITAFIGGILLGMGIDFGVHLSVRYFYERSRFPLQEALKMTMSASGRALATAAFTTAGALYLLFFSKFRGFWEFGLIAGSGVLITMLAFFLFFPVLVVLLEKFFTLRIQPAWHMRFAPLSHRFPVRSALILGIFLTVSIVFLPWGLSRLEFETNFRRLSGNPSTSVQYGKAMGDRASPTVMLCDTVEDCETLTTWLSRILSQPLHHPDIRDFNSIHTFIPKDQEQKLAICRQIREELLRALPWAEGELKHRLQNYLPYVPSKPITMNDLPDWLRRRFTEKNGEIGRFLYLYPARETWNAYEAALLKKSIAYLDLESLGGQSGKKVRAASSSFILVDILEVVRSEGVWIVAAALVLVFFLLLLDFRSLGAALLVLFPLVSALLWIAALLPLLGQRLGLYNMVVVSTIIGTGIDASVHLFHAGREFSFDPRPAFLRTGLAVCMAALTTLAGFAGMLGVRHGGLSSIGRLATLGLFVTLVCALLLVPSGFMLWRWLANRKETP